jgi:hypothetical protein
MIHMKDSKGGYLMRGDDIQQGTMFSHLSPEQRVPVDHPLRPIRQMVDTVLKRLSARFEAMYAEGGRPSIPPEKLLRALLLPCLYSVRSERLLMEQLDYNLLFCWFVGLIMDDPTWGFTVFSKNREHLLEAEVAALREASLRFPPGSACSCHEKALRRPSPARSRHEPGRAGRQT